MKVSGIYALVNKINNKAYIGQSVDIANRFSVHKRNVSRKDKKNYVIYNALNKYGWDNFYKIVIYYCNIDISNITVVKKDLTEKENFWINYFKNKNIVLYNIRSASDSNLGIKFSDDVKRNMGLSHLGREYTEETKKKMSLAQKGVPKTKEHIANIRKANLGKKLSDAHKKKLSISAKARTKGRVVSQDTRNKISIARMGIKFTEETRKKMSDAAKRRTVSSETKKKMCEAWVRRKNKIDIKKVEI